MSGPGKTSGAENDPLDRSAFRKPGILQILMETFLGKTRPLDVIQVEVTSHCPGRCFYCPHTTRRNDWRARHMAPETFAALWPLLTATRRVHLQGWGEPLLHPRFLDMADLARHAECQVSTTTCGVIMHEPLAHALCRSGIDVIAFSLAGATQESHDQARAGASFRTVMDSVRTLQAVRKKEGAVHLELHFAYLMLAGQVRDVLALPGLMAELGVHAAVVSTLDYLPGPEFAKEAFLPHETEKIARARELLETAVREARELGVELYYSLPREEPLDRCLEGIDRSLYVDADGNLAPCIYTNLPVNTKEPGTRVFGNCLGGDALEIWRGEAFAAFRNGLAGGKPDEVCRECPKRFAVGNRE